MWATDGCGLAIVGRHGLWFDGSIVMGGYGDGPMVGNYGLMGMGCGSDGRGFGSCGL